MAPGERWAAKAAGILTGLVRVGLRLVHARDAGDMDDLTKAVMNGLRGWYNADPEEFAKWVGTAHKSE